MRRTLTVAVMAAAALAACSSASTGTDISTTLPSDPSVNDEPIAVSDSQETTEADVAPSAPVATSAGDSVAAETELVDTEIEPVGLPLEIAVEADRLPDDVAHGLRMAGGELATTQDWMARFAPAAMPRLVGDGVHLVEAELDATRMSNGWQRIDAMQWLFTDAASVGVDGFLDQLAVTAGIESWTRNDDSSVVDSARCVERTYRAASGDFTWVLQGCEYPVFPGMVAVGITRTGTFGADEMPRLIEPSTTNVVDELDGRLDHVQAVFGAPSGAESTSTLNTSIEVSTEMETADAVTALAAGALAGWSQQQGEAGSVVFSGTPGHFWTVYGDAARFSSEGRLAP